MKSELLKPCAHCGHDAEHLIMDGWDRIGCKLCGTLGGRYGSKEKAIKAWNTRTGETAPMMSEGEILGMMPPDKDESKSRNPVDITFEVAYNHARQEIARALANRLQQPRKVERERIRTVLISQLRLEFPDIQQLISVDFERIADAIMKEIGDE